MKRTVICLLALLALTLPRLAHAQAQYSLDDDYGPPPYNDVDDGQALRIAGYILAPFGYALEWGLTRPMHYAATDTPLKPMLSGDTDINYFGQTTNADRLPSNTFAPFVVPADPNAIDSDASSAPLRGPGRGSSNVLPPVPQSEPGYRAFPLTGSGQSALH